MLRHTLLPDLEELVRVPSYDTPLESAPAPFDDARNNLFRPSALPVLSARVSDRKEAAIVPLAPSCAAPGPRPRRESAGRHLCHQKSVAQRYGRRSDLRSGGRGGGGTGGRELQGAVSLLLWHGARQEPLICGGQAQQGPEFDVIPRALSSSVQKRINC